MTQVLLVAAAVEAGSNIANAVNTIKMAEGFSKTGFDVTIVCRASNTGPRPESELTELYGIKNRLNWVQLPKKRFGRVLNAHGHFAAQLIPSLTRLKPDLVFSRSYIAPYMTAKMSIPTIAESHAHPDNTTRQFLKFIRGTGHNKL